MNLFNLFGVTIAEQGTWGQQLLKDIYPILVAVFTVAGSLALIFSVYLGFMLAKAEDEGKRTKAKKRIVNTIASLIMIAIMVTITVSLKDNVFSGSTSFNDYQLSSTTIEANKKATLTLKKNGTDYTGEWSLKSQYTDNSGVTVSGHDVTIMYDGYYTFDLTVGTSTTSTSTSTSTSTDNTSNKPVITLTVWGNPAPPPKGSTSTTGTGSNPTNDNTQTTGSGNDPKNGTGGPLHRISNVGSYAIKQGTSTGCKATSIAMMLDILFGTREGSTVNSMYDNSLANLTSVGPGNYTSYLDTKATDDNNYKTVYCTDNGQISYGGSGTISQSQQISEIDSALSNEVPIVVEVSQTKPGTASGSQHWVLVVGGGGGTYSVLNPATGSEESWSSSYFGASGGRYGYVKVYK